MNIWKDLAIGETLGQQAEGGRGRMDMGELVAYEPLDRPRGRFETQIHRPQRAAGQEAASLRAKAEAYVASLEAEEASPAPVRKTEAAAAARSRSQTARRMLLD